MKTISGYELDGEDWATIEETGDLIIQLGGSKKAVEIAIGSPTGPTSTGRLILERGGVDAVVLTGIDVTSVAYVRAVQGAAKVAVFGTAAA